MKRAKSRSVIERIAVLLEHIKEVKIDHPLWGYRRVWSYLKYRQGLTGQQEAYSASYERTRPSGHPGNQEQGQARANPAQAARRTPQPLLGH